MSDRKPDAMRLVLALRRVVRLEIEGGMAVEDVIAGLEAVRHGLDVSARVDRASEDVYRGGEARRRRGRG